MTSSNGNIFRATALCAGNSPVTPVTQSFDVFVDMRVKGGWVNNREAGEISLAHYDDIVM